MYKYLVVLAILMGCMGNPSITEAPPSGTLITHVIGASLTDPLITTPNGAHVTGLDPGKTSLNKLVIFLGGTASSPSSYQTLLKEVVALGYHVISLNYYNSQAVGALAMNDLAEYGKIRDEVVYGNNSSTLVSVSTDNSILNRIKKLLAYLALNYGSENWSQFLLASEPVWSKIVLSGYSQGAGHAAFLAKDFEVSRVVLFSGVVDGKVTNPRASADWITQMTTTTATPLTAFRFFESINDGNYPAIKANLATLGYDPGAGNDSGLVANVDNTSAPFGGKKVLLTSLVTDSSAAHPSTCEDVSTPIVDEIPVYRSVWQTLFQ